MLSNNKKLFGFPGTFWTANVMELFERWAWYGMFIILALYVTGSTDDGGLGFTQSQKGLLTPLCSFVAPFVVFVAFTECAAA